MNDKTKKAILKLNTDFYRKNYKEFHTNRQGRNWSGVEQSLSYIDFQKSSIKVIDLACGNGRLTALIKKRFNFEKINYIGIDNNKDLLKEAHLLFLSLDFQSYKLIKRSIFLNKLNLPRADLVFALGITHHIPSANYRKEWLKGLTKYVEKDGYLILSFWETDKQNTAKELPKLGIYQKDLEEGDIFFSWGESDVFRYYHKYSKKELLDITNLILDQGFSLIKAFEKKEFSKNANKYYVFKNKL